MQNPEPGLIEVGGSVSSIAELLKCSFIEMSSGHQTDAKTVFTLEQVSRHNGKDDLWIAIRGQVYDITNFAYEHPGGENILFEQAGTDATEVFLDIGHSQDAELLMKSYYIGDLCNDS